MVHPLGSQNFQTFDLGVLPRWGFLCERHALQSLIKSVDLLTNLNCYSAIYTIAM
jgi:hypothetical protein